MTSRRAGRKPFTPRITPWPGKDPRSEGVAACKLELAELFDDQRPGEDHTTYKQRTGAAKRVCRHCPIAEACLEFGTVAKSSGVCGGVLLRKGEPVTAAGQR